MLVLVLAVATVVGLRRRATDGRLRMQAAPAEPERDATPVAGTEQAADAADVQRLTAAQLAEVGGAPGTRATLLQFSSAFCAPCRTARVVLADVAAEVEGVAHVEVDAESHLDLVVALGVRRTPTTLVLDPAGRVVGRAVGAPRKAEVLAALEVV